MFKKITILILTIISLVTITLSSYLYININRLEKSYNIFIIQQLLLLERKNIKGSQSLMSSYIKNALISIDRNKELSNYNNFCSNWDQLKIILPKYTNIDIEKKHLSVSEQKIIKEQVKSFKKISQKISKICSQP